MIKKIARSIKFVIYIIAWIVLMALVCNAWVLISTQGYIFRDVESLPEPRDLLVLGTSPTTQDGRPNAFFQSRVRSAAALFKAGKARKILASGYSDLPSYDEPGEMKKALLAAGVPAEVILIDSDGLRTLDSVIRARDVFGRKSVTIVSDPFHVNRALFIAKNCGLDSIAYAPPATVQPPLWLQSREFLARIAAILDVFIFKTRPHKNEPIPTKEP